MFYKRDMRMPANEYVRDDISKLCLQSPPCDARINRVVN